MKKFFSTTIILGLLLISGNAIAADWSLDKMHTTIGFKVKHLAITSVVGNFDEYSGKIKFDPEKPEKLKIDVTIPVSSIDTDNVKRDDHLKSADFFDAEKYPNMKFKSKRTKVLSSDHFQVVGDLTIKDKTHEVTLDVTDISGPVMMGKERIGATATASIDRFDYGLNFDKKLETGGLVVSREVKIILDVQILR